MPNLNIAIFASGTGSNAQKIIEYFKDNPIAEISLVVSNKPTAPVLDMARSYGIPVLVIDRPYFYTGEQILAEFSERKIGFIVLAGFLWLVPDYLIKAYPEQIVNIHPALLPKYGGKGMYGMHVHRAVKQAGDKESGITIHYVDENYDEGKIIFQASCLITEEDNPKSIAQKVQKLEHYYYPVVIEEMIISKS